MWPTCAARAFRSSISTASSWWRGARRSSRTRPPRADGGGERRGRVRGEQDRGGARLRRPREEGGTAREVLHAIREPLVPEQRRARGVVLVEDQQLAGRELLLAGEPRRERRGRAEV